VSDDLHHLRKNPLCTQEDIERYYKDLRDHLAALEAQFHCDLTRLETYLRCQVPAGGWNWTQTLVKTNRTMPSLVAVRDWMTGAHDQAIRFAEIFRWEWDGRLNPDPKS
jgi:hypothetical protein